MLCRRCRVPPRWLRPSASRPPKKRARQADLAGLRPVPRANGGKTRCSLTRYARLSSQTGKGNTTITEEQVKEIIKILRNGKSPGKDVNEKYGRGTLTEEITNLMYKIFHHPLGIVKPCRRADPNLGSCVRDAFNTFIHQQFAGVPELGLESFDPLQMPYVNLSEAVPGNMTLSLLLRGVYVRGFSKANIIHVRANPEEQKLELMCRVPWLTADGVFSAEGEVLTFPLSAQGAFSVNMSEVSSSCIIYFSEQSVKKGGPKYFTVDHLEFDFTPVDVSYYFGDTLDEDNQLGTYS
ncbi:Protein takeout-like protein [Gryllus bimaculatus]|nr:Protein takeout-like protein [Gryllus bimaculatus]